jgi:predicted transcriptional regulator
MLFIAPRQLTIGEICQRLSEPPHRVRYVLRTRGIAPSSRAGVAGVYTDADLAQVRSELRRIDAEKEDAHS